MGATTPKASEKVLNSFMQRLKGRHSMRFDEFVDWALYDPHLGYYRIEKKRVGKTNESDFYTSSSLGKVWGELIIDACVNILGKQETHKYNFVEIGAEPGCSILEKNKHPFANHYIIRLDDDLFVPQRSIVYSNEWLDALPFRRFEYSHEHQTWMEFYVGIIDDQLCQIKKNLPNDLPALLPIKSSDGYLLDWPFASFHSLDRILSVNNWKGLFLTFDYGLDLKVLLEDRPNGTARAYSQQQMNSSILQCPGEQDITCHLCWDILEECLEHHGFKNINRNSQESFLIKNSANIIKQIFKDNNDPLNPDMLAIRELIHPAHLGHGMQALWATRL